MKKILVVYESPAGSTAEASGVIAEYLIAKGFDVTCSFVKNAVAMSEFDFAVIGSPVLYGKITSSMKAYLRNNSDALEMTPHSLFLTCMRLTECSNFSVTVECYRDAAFNEKKKDEKDMTSMEKNHSKNYYFDNIITACMGLDPVQVAFFKGNLNFSRLKFFSRLVMKIMVKLQDEVKEGDFLDKRKIEEWTGSLTEKINNFERGVK